MDSGRKPIVVVGSINLDFVANTDRIPVSGETVLGSDFQMHPGGKGANQAVAVARLGYPVQMIGKLGSDALGAQLRAHLQDAGVGLEGIAQANGSSGVAMIIVASHGENCIVVTPGANAKLTAEYVDEHSRMIQSAALVLVQLEIPLEAVERTAELCSQYSIPLILDPAPAKTLPHAILERVSWFTPNETEAAFFAENSGNSQELSSSAVAQRLLALGPRNVLLKLGERGAFLASGGEEHRIEPISVKAVDTTAAGDAFNGAFAVGLALGKSAKESAQFAAAAAALSVTRIGAQSSMPTLQEVERLLK
jgi:ribokinase